MWITLNNAAMFCSLFTNLCISALIAQVVDETMVQEYYFDYLALGPHIWSVLFPTCGSNRQSPIALDSKTADKADKPTISWYNWKNKPTTIKLKNSGHTVMMVPQWETKDAIPYVTLTKWPHPYIFNQLHFHWGRNATEGSEHTLDGKRFPLELHAALYRKDFSSYAEARRSSDGDALAVITLLYEIHHLFVNFRSKIGKSNDAFQSLISQRLRSIKYWGTWVFVPPESLHKLIPQFTTNYFLYNGSLTTPPCTEIAIFFVSRDVLTVADIQLKYLRRLYSNTRHRLTFNYRPLQELNDRKVSIIQ